MKFIQKYKKAITLILKCLILVFSVTFIYLELSKKDTVSNFIFLINNLKKSGSYLLLLLVFIGMFFNWFLEALKWRYLIQKVQPISISKSFFAVFSGLSVGIFTPNRIGEYGGRILYLKEENRIKGVLITFIGSITQMLITILCGLIAFLFYFYRFILSDNLIVYAVIYSIGVFLCILIYLYFNVNRLSSYLDSIKFLSRFKKYTHVFELYNQSDLFVTFFLSLFRYAVFSFQYYLLIRLFALDIAILDSLMMTSLVFFVQSILPSFTLAELGVRGAVAVYFLGHLTISSTGIVAAAFSLWLINLIFPSVIGLIFILNTHFFDNRS